MQLPGEMNVQGLALLGGAPSEGGEGAAFAGRMFDTDGDGQNDLFLVDSDNDGSVDGVVRGLDADGDGLLDTFVQYDEDGEVEAVGRLDPGTREFTVFDGDDEGFADILSSLGPADAPDEGLFTTFDDPFLLQSLGTYGDEVPEVSEPLGEAAGVDLHEVEEADLTAPDPVPAGDQGSAAEGAEASLPEVTPRVVEIEDWSGAGDGSDLHAKIDQDGDGLADDDQKLFRTSDGTWHGDINRDGYSEAVAFDRDQDGRIESVDTTGRGSSTDTVGAEQVVSPESPDIVDRQPGEDDFRVEEEPATADDSPAAGQETGDGYSAADSDAGPGYDSGGSSDAGSSYDPGPSGGSSSPDPDPGSTTIDSGSSGDSGSSDV